MSPLLQPDSEKCVVPRIAACMDLGFYTMPKDAAEPGQHCHIWYWLETLFDFIWLYVIMFICLAVWRLFLHCGELILGDALRDRDEKGAAGFLCQFEGIRPQGSLSSKVLVSLGSHQITGGGWAWWNRCGVHVRATCRQWNKDMFFGGHGFKRKLRFLPWKGKGQLGSCSARCQNVFAGFLPATCTIVNSSRLRTNESCSRSISIFVIPMRAALFQQTRWHPGSRGMADKFQTVMCDWFQIFLAHGVANREFGLLAGSFRGVRICKRSLNDLRPSQNGAICGADSKKNIWKKVEQRRANQLQCQWDGHGVSTRSRTHSVKWAWKSQTRWPHRSLKLMECLDSLMTLNRGGTCTSHELSNAIRSRLQPHLDAYGDQRWVPKYHCSPHLGSVQVPYADLLRANRSQDKRSLASGRAAPVCAWLSLKMCHVFRKLPYAQVLWTRLASWAGWG